MKTHVFLMKYYYISCIILYIMYFIYFIYFMYYYILCNIFHVLLYFMYYLWKPTGHTVCPTQALSWSVGSWRGLFKSHWWETQNGVCRRTTCRNIKGFGVFWRTVFSKWYKRTHNSEFQRRTNVRGTCFESSNNLMGCRHPVEFFREGGSWKRPDSVRKLWSNLLIRKCCFIGSDHDKDCRTA